MIEEEEVQIFLNEITKLQYEYDKCSDEDIKKIIKEDILHLEEIIPPTFESFL